MLKVKVPAKLSSLNEVNAFVINAIPLEFQNVKNKILLATEELLVNTANYAYVESEELSEIEFSCQVTNYNDEQLFCIEICDTGKPFDPFTEAKQPDINLDFEDRPIGGLGIFLIKSITKYYTYQYIDNKNKITLYFAKA